MKRMILVAMCLAPVAAASGQNLVRNGNFESGASSWWTNFQAGWSSGISRTFNSTEPGRIGNYCLKLQGGSGSFGVYQQVATTPGRRYKIDAYWKGAKAGDPVWFELILIDGPFSMQQADEQPYVANNFMYAYDPAPGSFDWVWCHDLNGTPADRNNRNGIRTASGTVMTVVLKTGGIGGMSCFFDEVTLIKIARPDFDADLDVDLVDFAFFQACFNGPNTAPAHTGCTPADFDQDGDVDLTDFASFQVCFNGPNMPPGPNCD